MPGLGSSIRRAAPGGARYVTTFVAKMLETAREQAVLGFETTLLLPVRITNAFRQYVMRGADSIWLADKRLVFFENGVPRCSKDKRGVWHPDPAMFDSMIVRYVPGTDLDARPRLHEWKVPAHVTDDDIDRYKQMRVPLYDIDRSDVFDVSVPN